MNKASTVRQLDDEFRTQVFMLGKTIINLQLHEQDLAADWLQVLMSFYNSVEKARLRNDCMHYLVKSCINGELVAPFHEDPSEEKVLVLPNLLPKSARSCTRCGRRVSKKNDQRKQSSKKHNDRKKR